MINHMGESRAERPDFSKREQYEQLCGGAPDAFFVLGGGVVKNTKTGEPKSGSYRDNDTHNLLSGSKARVVAAAELHQYFPEAAVVANSSLKNEKTSNAQLFAKEMIERGVDESKVILQQNSYNTFTEMLELVRMIVDNNWKHAVVVTNEFQIPRARIMLEKIDELHDPNNYWQRSEIQKALDQFRKIKDSVTVSFVSAEDALPIKSSKYIRIVAEAKASPGWQARVASEQQGVGQIERGEYWNDPPKTMIRE